MWRFQSTSVHINYYCQGESNHLIFIWLAKMRKCHLMGAEVHKLLEVKMKVTRVTLVKILLPMYLFIWAGPPRPALRVILHKRICRVKQIVTSSLSIALESGRLAAGSCKLWTSRALKEVIRIFLFEGEAKDMLTPWTLEVFQITVVHLALHPNYSF